MHELLNGTDGVKDDYSHEQQQVVLAVEDMLRTPVDSAYKMDVHGAATLIAAYVFHGQSAPHESQRYEWYYMLLGKSIAIAQAWKQNFAGALNSPSETPASLIEYIDNTYGAHTCEKAGIST